MNSYMNKIVNPFQLFLVIWLVGLGTYTVKISTLLSPNQGILWVIFIFSIVFFALGFFGIRVISELYALTARKNYYSIVISQRRLTITLVMLWLVTAIIVLLNLASQGLPPVFSTFGFNTLNYKEYGRAKGVLYPLLIALFVLTIYSEKRWLSKLMRIWSTCLLIAYISRGNIIIMLVQALLVLLLYKPMSKKVVFGYVSGFFLMLLLLMSVVGEFRTGTKVFIVAMGIKKEYQDWYPGFLWVASYISLPLSNLAFIVDTYHSPLFGEGVLSRMLPAFSVDDDPIEDAMSNMDGVMDNAHTYLGIVFVDFLWGGIILLNLILGVVGGLFYWTRIGIRYSALFAVFLSQIVLLEFSYFYFTFSFLVESVTLLIAMRYFSKPRIVSSFNVIPKTH